MTKSKVVSHFMCQCIIRSLVICILTPRFPLKCTKQTMVCNLFRLLGSSTVLTETAESVEGCIALMTWKGLKRPKFNFLVQLSELQNLPCSNRKSYLSRFLQQYGKFFWKSREYTFQNKIFHFIATHNISRKKKQTFVFNKIMQSFWLKKQFLQRNVWLEEKG